MMVDVPGYEGMYKINESGVVINKKGHPLRTAISNAGYLRVAFEPRNSMEHRTNKSIHRLVAETFIPNPDNLPIVMHIDNDKLNNHVSNLKWGTQSDNVQQAVAEGRMGNGNRSYPTHEYEIYNDDERITCTSRTEVADTIGYKEISLKNMVGNGREIALGPYKGYKIRRVDKEVSSPIYFIPHDEK